MTIEKFNARLDEELAQLKERLESWTYKPKPVRRVEIAKPDKNAGVRLFGLLLFVLVVSGCAETHFIATGNTYEPWEGPVKILNKPPAGVKYEEIGWISGKMGGMVSDWGAILKAMQKSARKKGANAIILINKEASSQSSLGGSVQYGFYGGSYQEKNLMAIAIRTLE